LKVSRFSVGDPVVYIGHSERIPDGKYDPIDLPRGTHGVVQEWPYPNLPMGFVVVEFEVRSAHYTGWYLCRPAWLKPAYDGEELVSWSDCVWQPNKVAA
jgi:hypothetical protein